MFKKKTAAILLALLQIVMLTACTQSSGGGEPAVLPPPVVSSETPTANAKPFEGQTLTINSFLTPDGTSPREKALREIYANFTEKTGAKISVSVIPWQEVDNQLLLSVQANNAPDITWVRYQNFPRNIAADALLPLDDFVQRDFSQEDKERYLLWEQAGFADGRKYCIPTSLLCLTFVGRQDVLDKAGKTVPRTWDEFISVAKAVNTPEMPAFLFECNPAQQTQIDWLQPMIESRGGKILDETGKAIFDSPEGVATFQFLKDCIYTHKISPKQTATMQTNEVIDNFTSGKASFIFLASQRFQVQVDALGKEKLFMAAVPGLNAEKSGPAVALPWMMGIPKNAKNPELAWEFIKFFTSDKSQYIYLSQANELPCVNSLNEDPYMETDYGKTVKWILEYIESNPTSGIAEPTYAELADVVATSLQQVVASPDTDVQAILTKACAKYNQILES